MTKVLAVASLALLATWRPPQAGDAMTPAWDRLLETCYRRNASVMLLAPGSPPLLRLDDEWRALQVSPLEAEDVASMAAAQLSPKPDGERDGYAYADFWYGEVNAAFFRAMAFGFPATRLLMVSRIPRSRPGPADPRFLDR